MEKEVLQKEVLPSACHMLNPKLHCVALGNQACGLDGSLCGPPKERQQF